MRYKLTEAERDYIQSLYYDKVAREELLSYCCRMNRGFDLGKQFEKVYQRAVAANKKYNLCFERLMRKHLPPGTDSARARVEFNPCEIVVED